MAGRTGVTRLNDSMRERRDDRITEAVLKCKHKFIEGVCIYCGAIE